MAKQRAISRVGRRPVRGGTEVSIYSRSERGTSFLVDSVVVLRGKASKAEHRQALADALGQLLKSG